MITATDNVDNRTTDRSIGEDISVLVKAAAAVIAIGVLVLIGVAVKDRINSVKLENHKEV